MLFKYDAAIIGGDLRQNYLADILCKNNYKIITFGLYNNSLIENTDMATSLKSAIKSSKFIITPIPFSRDKKHINILNNKISNSFKELTIEEFLTYLLQDQCLISGNIPIEAIQICDRKNIRYDDLMQNNEVAMLNAIATSEGAIAEAIYKSNINLHYSNALVLGYGKCGKILAIKLHALGVNVTVGARKKEALTEAYTNNLKALDLNGIISEVKNFNFIFNTIPNIIITEEILLSLSPETTIIDIASSPNGIDYEAAKKLNVNAHLCLGIPGEISPKSSALILADVILPILNERND